LIDTRLLGWVVQLGLVISAMVCGPGAGAVMISPVLVDLSVQKPIVAVWVRNDSSKVMRFQVETLNWQQQGQQDIYEPTQDLLVVPPLVDIAAGATQVLTVSWRPRAGMGQGEHAYRLMIEDITGESDKRAGALELRFRHNLPVFAMPMVSARFAANWSQCVAPAGQGCVRLDNAGNQRIRVHQLTLEGRGWTQLVRGGATVLAGAWTQWFFDMAGHSIGPIHVRAKAEGMTLTAEIPPALP